MTTAVAYFRTSSAANVGTDKDSLKRQQEAVEQYAAANGLDLLQGYYDAAVSGADPINERPGFIELLHYLRSNGARIILVENASRFARDLAVQITGHELLKAEGFELIPVDAPDHFINETPTAVMVRNILGAVSQFEKASLVDKLRKARDRKRAATGRCEGRIGIKGTTEGLAMISEAKRLRRVNPLTGKRRSLRKISAELASLGFTRDNGQPFSASTINGILKRP